MPVWRRRRRQGELYSYGVSPASDGESRPATALLQSAAHVRADLCANGCPLQITFPAGAFAKDGIRRLRALIEGYFARGGAHFAMNVADAALLEQAKKTPAEHEELLIKISGLSAKFVTLDAPLQDALIERAKTGV